MKKNKNKIHLKDKIAMNIFISSVPNLIELWHKNSSEKTFDEFLLDLYEESLKIKKGGVKNDVSSSQ